MGWLIELLIEGIQEKCSQFIIDMMEVITEMFTELLSCNLNLFEELFGVVGALYKNVIVPLAIALLLLILVWQLFKGMFGKMGLSSEDPIELICRSGACLFMVVGAKTFVNYILGVAGTPYQWIVGIDIKVSSFSEYVSSLEGVTAVLGIDSISMMLLTLIMQLVVAWNYFKMLFVVAERYVLLGVFSYTAPLAFATGGSKSTNNILSSWAKMFGGQIVLIIMNAWCMKMFLSGYGNMLASGYGFTKFFAATLCLIGFCKITFKLDTYMASLGVNLGRPSGGMGAMGLVMAASRIFSHLGGSSSTGSAPAGGSSGTDSTATAETQGMPNGFAAPIPMSADEPAQIASNGDSEQGPDDMNETFLSGNDVHESESDNVLEVLGEIPDGHSENRDADALGDKESSFNDRNSLNTSDDDVSSLEDAMTAGGNATQIGMPSDESAVQQAQGIQDHPVLQSDMQSEMYSDMQSDIDGEGWKDDSGDNIMEILNQESSMEGMGDYPVDRKTKAKADENETEMDLQGGTIQDEILSGEASGGDAGPAYENTLSGGRSSDAQMAPTDPGIMHELGAASAIENSLTSLPGSSAADSIHAAGENGEGLNGVIPDQEHNYAGNSGLEEMDMASGKGNGTANLADGDILSDSEMDLQEKEADGLSFGQSSIYEDFKGDELEPVPDTVPGVKEIREPEMNTDSSDDGDQDNSTPDMKNGFIPGTETDEYGDIPENLMQTQNDDLSYDDGIEQPMLDVPDTREELEALQIGSMDDGENYPL